MRLTTRAVAALLDAGQYAAILETPFTDAVIALAQQCDWAAAHFRPGKTMTGWRTAVQGDGAGFTDLVLVRERVIFAELKSEIGTLSADQERWRDRLRTALQTWVCWAPRDWPEIRRILA